MISSQDRSYYFGCSDTSMVVGNWTTKSFEKWWLEKLGIYRSTYTNDVLLAGTYYEHKILDKISELKGIEIEKDKQIIHDRLRANLDGNTEDHIYEVKTYNIQKDFKVSKQYWRQAQVEMYASDIHNLSIVSYALKPEDYNNYFNEIDESRINYHDVEYDENFINQEYKPKLLFLSYCLENGKFPRKEEYDEFKINRNDEGFQEY